MKFLFIVTFISLFFVYFAFDLVGLVVPWYFVCLGLFISTNTILNFNEVKNSIKNLLSNFSFKILLILIYWIVLGISFSLTSGKFSLPGFINNFLGSIIFSVLLTYLSMIIAIPKLISLKEITKLTLLVFLGIYILGIIDFTGAYFNISFIQKCFSILVNRISLVLDIQRGFFTAFGLPRAASIFNEPSFLGYFITITLPITFNISFSKNPIFNNPVLDFWIKKSVFILMIINLFLTQSPIFFLICSIEGLLYLLFKIRKILSLTLVSSFTVLICLIIIFTYGLGNNLSLESLNIDAIFLGRIIKTAENLTSLNSLIIIEPSLATRVANFFNQFFIFMQNPIIGVGFGNLNSIMPSQILNSPIPITNELYSYANQGRAGGGTSIFFKYLAETGIVGCSLLYTFFLSLLKSLKDKTNNFSGIERDFLTGLKFFLIVVIATSMYDSNPNSSILWLFIGVIQAVLIKY